MITLATSYSGKHKRVRYMLPRINWLMEQTKALAFKLFRLGTTLLPADVATKNGQSGDFRSKRACVMGAGGNGDEEPPVKTRESPISSSN